ncbi:MAG: UvrD-helicase domain-containing protein [Chitinophagales bacterium]|nr:UvrD-helicase domain-containing protein [Chitinophagales bacterium]
MQQNLTICTASAGSGKTFSLIKEYLKILIQNPHNFSSILAITFTNKAATEMKERLIAELERLATNINTPMGKELAIELQHYPNPEAFIQKNAQIALSRIIHNYSGLSIMTIDSFFQLLVNSFAKELKIPIGSSIEVDMDVVLDAATKRLFEDLDNNEALIEWLFEYMKHQLETGLSWHLDINISQIGKELVKEISTEYFKNIPAEEIIRLKELLLRETRNIETNIKSSAKKCLQIFQTLGLEKDNIKSGIHSFYEKLALKPKKYYNEDFATLKKWIFNQEIPLVKDRIKTDPALVQKIETAYQSGIERLTKEMINTLEDKKTAYISFVEVTKNIFNLGIIHELNEKIKEFRSRENTLLISDTKTLLKGLITETDAPFILEKAGNQYQHILLDEFQDTSDIQWEILKPLIINTLSQNGNVFIVGDAKQAIYKWRGGNVQLIVSEIKQALSMFLPKENMLNTNYRSAQEIVRFNSAFFEKLSETLQFSAIYKNIVQQPFAYNNKTGFVEVNFIPKDDKEEKPMEIAFQWVAEKIRTLLQDGWKAKDMAIIIRKNYESQYLTKILNEQNIQVISESSRSIAQYPAVKLIIQILRYIHQPIAVHYTNILYLGNALNLWNLNTESIFNDHKNLHPDSPDKLLLGQFIPFLAEENLLSLAQSPIYALIEDLIRALKFEIAQDTYLIQFLDIILQYTSSKLTNIASFLQWWEAFHDNYSIRTSGDTDAIRILTIHKSKGLEFPIVFLPWLDWDTTPKTGSLLWVKTEHPPFQNLGNIPVECGKILEHTYFSEAYEQERKETLLESLNLLYVAFTRAQEQMYICSQDGKVNSIGKLTLQTMEEVFYANKTETNVYKIGTYAAKSLDEQKTHASILPITSLNTPYKEMTLKKDYTSEEIEIGERIHETLALIHRIEDTERIIHQQILSGKIKIEDSYEMYEKIQAVFEIEAFRNWMQHATILNERDIFSDKKILRPDRFFMFQNTIIIVDFKTGKVNDAYNAQIKRYANAFLNMGYPHVEGYLLYINDQPSLTKIV